MKKIALVCTGSCCEDPHEPWRCKAYLHQHYGFESVFSEDTYNRIHPCERARILLERCLEPEIDVIWAVRGGEGSADCLPYLEEHQQSLKSIKPKLLIGFSDFTPVLIYFMQQFGWQTIHGASPLQFVQQKIDKPTEKSLVELITGQQQEIIVDQLQPLNDFAKQNKIIEEKATGGCLSLVNISIKDIWEVETKNKIIILEDVKEQPHKVNRTLKYLQRIGFFDQAAAVIFGDFNCYFVSENDNKQDQNKKSMLNILQRFAESCSFPVLLTDKIGHGKTNLPVVFAPAKLSLGDTAELTTCLSTDVRNVHVTKCSTSRTRSKAQGIVMHKTPLYEEHQKAGAKLVDFAGWEMPIHYGSQIEEHHAVRKHAGVFDVSHMTIVDVGGQQSFEFLQYLLANDVAKLKPGKALYSCLLNETGGVTDDLIVYQLAEQSYRLVVNAATREKDLAWLDHHVGNFAINIEKRDDLAMLAIQGPEAFHKTKHLFAADINQLKPFHFLKLRDWLIACMGYTGEEGVEVILPAKEAVRFWQEILAVGVHPCGLGARDTLRLEAGLNLYGQDMDETTTPLESNLAWTVAFEPGDREFIGREALENQKDNGVEQKLVGLVLQERGICRHGQKVIIPNVGEGVITSGTYSPTLERAIGFARVPIATQAQCLVEIRNKRLAAALVKPPFVRFGKCVVHVPYTLDLLK